MSLLSKLFGAKGATAPEPVKHESFLIFPDPVRESGGFRLGARIEKEIGGELKTHQMIRADTFQSPEQASEAAILKAKIFIDQLGDDIFR